jgi:hypothetical protein
MNLFHLNGHLSGMSGGPVSEEFIKWINHYGRGCDGTFARKFQPADDLFVGGERLPVRFTEQIDSVHRPATSGAPSP